MKLRTISLCVQLLPEGAAASPICFLDSKGLRLSINRKSLRKSTERELHSFAGVSTVDFMGYAVAGGREEILCVPWSHITHPREVLTPL